MSWYVRAAMTAHRTDRWQRLSFSSDALAGNPLGDPQERPLWVWSPADTSRRYPSIYLIQGMAGMVDAWFNVSPWTESFPDAIERLAPDAVVVLVDAFTSVGGSQFLDSSGIGRYHTYLCDEIVPFVDGRFPTLAEARHRGIQGKSSGGYGAMITPMLRPDLFGGLATHAGDAVFELCYQAEFAPAARALREKYDGSFDEFWRDFRSGRPVLLRPGRHTCSSTPTRWPPLTRRTRTERSISRSTSRRGSSCRTCSPAGSRGTRCGWRATILRMPRRFSGYAPCGSTPGRATSTTSISAPPRSGRPSPTSAFPTT